MSQDVLDRLIAGTHPDPDGGPPLRVETRAVAIAKSLAGAEADLVRPLSLGRRLAVVSDPTTHAILGARVEQALKSLGEVASTVLPEHPHADSATADWLREATSSADALVAVGSGTINDLCKYASARDRKPYVVFGTAPSMNGYTSVNAAITVGGHKKSLAAQAPLGAFLDLSILVAAPVRMIRSGLGDSLCRSTAQADWLLSHLLLDLPYRTMPFALLAEDEPELFASAEPLVNGDLGAMEKLVRTLLLSGFGTAICGNSLPASQGEHLISHYGDMMDPGRPFSFHGEQIGVTTLTMARLQGRLLDGPPPAVEVDRSTEADFIDKFGSVLGPSCWKDYCQKRLTPEKAEAVNHRIAAKWQDMRAAIGAISLHADMLALVLKEAGAPRSPEDLGWPRASYEDAVRHARKIRNRYTFLDLAADAGILDRMVPVIT
ncbi:MAG TPA: iron-containing alcohol dehydrogenase [Dongiaceae bacterium]|jgi:glycerol-1-phosphate dehydrogenase [NAD(P)+]|nr:iron-containing alcohol dehydrogenase [Dongiaceae bacterium]